MTTSSQVVESVIGQESQGCTVSAAALMLTSAVLTFLVGVFALAADELEVSGPGYEYTESLVGDG